jgi:stage V sporulation protein D (sporulation-specific penicillin-binding protein)
MFSTYIHKRINIVMLIIIICFLLIIGKVFYIQVIDYDKLNKLANGLWSRNLPIEADRGSISTSDGIVIANNLTTVSLVFIPNQIDKDKKEEIALKISKILDCDVSAIKEHLYKKSSIERVHPEGRRLSYEQADKIDALGYEGVYLVKESKRVYPHDLLLCHVLGYVGIDNQGLSGLELKYDKYLTGAGGSIQYYSDAKGNKLTKTESYVQPTDGMNIELTVNYNIQSSIERELDNAMTKYNADGAWAIAMNPNSGEILGMASRPGFDPNNYKNYSVEEINRNLAIWASYEPGSTFKIITLSTAIEEGKVDLVKDTFYDGGSVNVDGARIKCWKHGGHGQQTFLEVVQNSCNPGFVELGRRLGTNTLFKYINNFGFGRKTGIDLNGEGSGILFSLSQVGPVELATTAFGQGVSVTALQQITAVSAAINGGTLYKPYIVKRITDPNTNDIIQENKKTVVKKNIISKKTSKQVRYALESVVALGTGRNAYIENYRVGGKTGTAQKVNNGVYMSGNYIVSFIGFLPANNPEVVVYVAIDNPKGITAYGGTVSAPIAKNILEDSITALNIKKPKTGLEKEYRYFDTKYYTLENVVGMNVKDAIKILDKFKVEYSGSGSTVISMSPSAGSRVAEGSSIRLMLAN